MALDRRVARVTPSEQIRVAHAETGARDVDCIELQEIPGVFEGVLGVAYGNPLLLGAQVLPLSELESGERAGFRQGQRRVGWVIPVEFSSSYHC